MSSHKQKYRMESRTEVGRFSSLLIWLGLSPYMQFSHPVWNQCVKKHSVNTETTMLSRETSQLSSIAKQKPSRRNRNASGKWLVPFPDDSEIDKFSKSNNGRFSGLSLISSPVLDKHPYTNPKFNFVFAIWLNIKGTKIDSEKSKGNPNSQKASRRDWETLRLTLTTTGLSSSEEFGGALELSPLFAMFRGLAYSESGNVELVLCNGLKEKR